MSGKQDREEILCPASLFFTLTFRAIYYSLSITKDMKEGRDEYAA